MLGRIAKRIDWEVFLQRMKGRRDVWDRISSSEVLAEIEQGRIYSGTFASSPEYAAEEEYVYDCRGRFLIHPDCGYVIAEPHTLLYRSLPGSEKIRTLNRRKPVFWCMPAPLPYLTGSYRRFPTRKLTAVVNMRYVHDGNYYHFLQDNLNRLKMLDDCGIDRSIPLVFSPALTNTSFFREACGRGLLDGREWFAQEDFYIEAERVIFARSAQYRQERVNYALELMHTPLADPKARRRIFLTRSSKSRRYLLNNSDILPVVERNGFEIIETDGMTLAEQMTLFGQTRYCVAVHGAGLTNMIFRREQPMNLIEIFPPTSQPDYYPRLAHAYGFRHYSLIGTDPVRTDKGHDTPFRLSPELLQKSIDEMFQNDPDVLTV